jgi:hypothetical protein
MKMKWDRNTQELIAAGTAEIKAENAIIASEGAVQEPIKKVEDRALAKEPIPKIKMMPVNTDELLERYKVRG